MEAFTKTRFLTFYRKRLFCILNSEIVSLFHWPFSMSSNCPWWRRPPPQCPSPAWECKRVSTQCLHCRDKSSLGFSIYFQEQKRSLGEGANQRFYCKWYYSSFLQGAKLEYNDYIEEHLRERGWSNLREMKTEGSSWHLVLHYSPWDRRHKYSKLPVRCLFFLEWMTSKILAIQWNAWKILPFCL